MSEMENLVFTSKPKLRKPYVVCGMNGWVNAGDVSAGGVTYFINQFKAEKFAEMPASRYHIYQIAGLDSLRPVFKMRDGLIVDTQLPRNEFYYALNPSSDNDLIFFSGNEPSLYWEEYADTVVGLADSFGATRLIGFGGLFDNTPYTREPRISCTCSDDKVRDEMDEYNVMFSNREGSATFNQMLVYACKKKGLDGIAMTVRVPYYSEFNVIIGYYPKAIKAVLVRLNHMMHLDMNFEDLDSKIKELEGKIDFVRRQNSQFNTYLEDLEKEYVEMPFEETLDISPHEAIRFAEEFLKNNKDNLDGK